ncbi:MAG: hypothetical protein PHN19_05405 [Patescibacteria group bacterium]|nr:hypothetical protein [Patescibacteria group bacterium]
MAELSNHSDLNLGIDWTRIVHNMSTIQLKVTLSKQLHSLLQKKAQTIGLTMSSYVKNLIVDDIKDLALEEKVVSKQVENNYQEAIENKKQSIKVTNLKETLDNL